MYEAGVQARKRRERRIAEAKEARLKAEEEELRHMGKPVIATLAKNMVRKGKLVTLVTIITLVTFGNNLLMYIYIYMRVYA